MKRLLPAMLILLAGCAQQVTSVSVPGIEQSNSVKVTDLRPESEKQPEIFSYVVSSDAYAIYRIADTSVVPPATRILQHRAFEKFGAGSAPLEIKIHHLVIYRNLQSEFRTAAMLGGIGGAIGGAIAYTVVKEAQGFANSAPDIKVFESLAATEFRRAYYTEQENSDRASVNVIYIETEIRGRRVFTRAVSPTVGKNREDLLPAALESAIKFHLAQYP